ncbi:hypothetical protein Hte_000479 [Hypoxylon texense]
MVPSKKQQWMTGPTFSVDDIIDPALSSDSSAATSTAAKQLLFILCSRVMIQVRFLRPEEPPGPLCANRHSLFCIRILKIRRVKCDETKPACTRCTSTGRKCDGYDGQAPPRRKKAPPPTSTSADPSVSSSSSSSVSNSIIPSIPTEPHLARRHEQARHSFAAACRRNSALRVLRPLAADIEGTEQERRFFHQFRRHAEAGLAVHAPGLGSGFWQRLVPLLGHSDAAVRHALIALGASYQSAQLQLQLQEQQDHVTSSSKAKSSSSSSSSRRSSPDHGGQQYYRSVPTSHPQPDDGSSSSSSSSRYQHIEQLDLFTIQQYNLSIYHLQRHVQPGSPPESVETTLVCCLVFVCVETSRGNEAGALSHVANGLQIIRTMPPELLMRTGTYDGGRSGHAAAATPTAVRISPSDWRQLVDFFLALEPSAAAYESPSPPCPPADMWTPPLEYFGEMPGYWETEANDVETWS